MSKKRVNLNDAPYNSRSFPYFSNDDSFIDIRIFKKLSENDEKYYAI